MLYSPTYSITPNKIINLVSKISEAVSSFYGQDKLRLHRINRIKTIQRSLVIEGNILTLDQVTAVLDGKLVVVPLRQVQEMDTGRSLTYYLQFILFGKPSLYLILF